MMMLPGLGFRVCKSGAGSCSYTIIHPNFGCVSQALKRYTGRVTPHHTSRGGYIIHMQGEISISAPFPLCPANVGN